MNLLVMKVSIIIPVYNAEQFFEDCLHSVAVQTMKGGVECILVDDCGSDCSIEIAEKFIEENPDCGISFKIFHQTHNQGPSAARNAGIKEALGEYIFFLDADDSITPECLTLLYSLAKEYDADYVQGTYEGSARQVIPNHLSDKKGIKRLLLDHNRIPFTPHNRLVRRQMILDHNLFFDERIRVREDFLWMTFVAKHVNSVAYCDKVTYHRGVNEDSLTHNVNRDREILGYRVLIETMVANYDSFQLGFQKEVALEALLMALRAGYYHNEEERLYLIQVVNGRNTLPERLLLSTHFCVRNSFMKTKLLHLLIRLYKLND